MIGRATADTNTIADTTVDTVAIAAYISNSVLSRRLPVSDRTDEAIRFAVARKFGDVGDAQLREASRLAKWLEKLEQMLDEVGPEAIKGACTLFEMI